MLEDRVNEALSYGWNLIGYVNFPTGGGSVCHCVKSGDKSVDKPVAAYIYCPPDKSYDYDMMQDYLVDKVTEAGMDPKTIEVYADGWDKF